MIAAFDDEPLESLRASEIELCAAAVRGGVMRDLDAGDINSPDLRAVYEGALDLARRDEVVCATTIAAELRATGMLELLRATGGLALLVDLVSYRPVESTIPYHADRIREAARMRRLARHALQLARAASDGDDDQVAAVIERLLEVAA
jgi:replicative DNA helicase